MIHDIHSFTSQSQPLLPPRLNRQKHHRHKRRQNQRSTNIHRRAGIRVRDIRSDDRGAEPTDAVQETADTGPGTSVGRGEHFGRVGVQDAVHDVLEEGFDGRESELVGGVGGDGEEEEEDAREGGRDGHGAFAAHVRDVDGVAGDERAGDADDGCDGVVAVGCVAADCSAGCGFTLGEVLGEEGVEEWVAHSDGEPAEPEEAGGPTELLFVKKRPDALTREGGKLPLHDFGVAELGVISD